MLSHSAKALSYEDNKLIVKDWLSKNKIVYDQLLFTMEEKLNVCIDNNIDIMIEDKPQGILDISTKIPVICFHASYNENCKNDNIYRCYSWYDILYTINEIIK